MPPLAVERVALGPEADALAEHLQRRREHLAVVVGAQVGVVLVDAQLAVVDVGVAQAEEELLALQHGQVQVALRVALHHRLGKRQHLAAEHEVVADHVEREVHRLQRADGVGEQRHAHGAVVPYAVVLRQADEAERRALLARVDGFVAGDVAGRLDPPAVLVEEGAHDLVVPVVLGAVHLDLRALLAAQPHLGEERAVGAAVDLPRQRDYGAGVVADGGHVEDLAAPDRLDAAHVERPGGGAGAAHSLDRERRAVVPGGGVQPSLEPFVGAGVIRHADLRPLVVDEPRHVGAHHVRRRAAAHGHLDGLAVLVALLAHVEPRLGRQVAPPCAHGGVHGRHQARGGVAQLREPVRDGSAQGLSHAASSLYGMSGSAMRSNAA